MVEAGSQPLAEAAEETVTEMAGTADEMLANDAPIKMAEDAVITEPDASSLLMRAQKRTTDDKTGKDHVGYLNYALVLSMLIFKGISTPSVIGLYANWGTGKSFIMNKVAESLCDLPPVSRLVISHPFRFVDLLIILNTSLVLVISLVSSGSSIRQCVRLRLKALWLLFLSPSGNRRNPGAVS